MSVLSPTAKLQFTDITGAPLVGGFLYTYVAGTTTPLATYTDSSGTTFNSNPVVLNARGEANVWLSANIYKFKLTDSNNNEIWTVDNISAPISSISPILSGNVEISTDSASPALKITQVGAGAVLLAQDSSDPDSSPFVITANGRIGLGTLSPTNALTIDTGALDFTESGTVYTRIYADASASIFDASDAGRALSFRTNSIGRLTITDTLSAFATPVVVPNDPTVGTYAANKNYVDGLTGSTAGIIAAFAGTTAPSGWLACQGQVISQTTYADLYAAIGTTWDIGGEGAGNFRLPDLRGMFLRGAGTNATGSSSGAVGQPVSDYAADTYLNHSHAVTDPGHAHSYTACTASLAGAAAGGGQPTGATTSSQTTGLTVDTSTTGGTETKPKNYGVLYIIKT
jgi:microcystin-dependent protein